MYDYETITVDVRGAAHWLTLNRPDSLNAINTKMASELRDYFGNLFQDRECRVVVMRGAGRAFCAGLDIKDHEGLKDAPFGGGFGFQGHLADVYVRMRPLPSTDYLLSSGRGEWWRFCFCTRN